MIAFFGLVAALGLIMVWLDHASETPDSIPTELAGHRGLGFILIVVGAIGAGCVAVFG